MVRAGEQRGGILLNNCHEKLWFLVKLVMETCSLPGMTPARAIDAHRPRCSQALSIAELSPSSSLSYQLLNYFPGSRGTAGAVGSKDGVRGTGGCAASGLGLCCTSAGPAPPGQCKASGASLALAPGGPWLFLRTFMYPKGKLTGSTTHALSLQPPQGTNPVKRSTGLSSSPELPKGCKAA